MDAYKKDKNNPVFLRERNKKLEKYLSEAYHILSVTLLTQDVDCAKEWLDEVWALIEENNT